MIATILDMNQRMNADSHNTKEMLNILAEALIKAKMHEEDAKRSRVLIEEKIIDLIGAKDEGAYTVNTALYKLTTKGNLSRKVDWEMYESQIKEQIPEALRPVKMKPELDTKGLHYLQNNEPSIYAIMAKCVTVTPNKTSVTVEAKEKT